MSTLRERLSLALQESGKTKIELARACGVAHPSVTHWLDGKTKSLSAENALKASAFLGVSVTWLTTGHGDRHSNNVASIFSEDDSPEGYVSIPEYRVCLGAGDNAVPSYEEATEAKKAYYREDFFLERGTKPEYCKRLKVHGDSMYPILFDGDTVLVDCQPQRIVSGKIYAFGFGEEVRVKRLYTQMSGGILVQSENPSIPDETIPAEEVEKFYLIGRVIDRSGGSPF